MASESIQLSELTWEEISSRIRSGTRRILFPFGSTEQHGPHLPLDIDTFVVDRLAKDLARGLGHTLVAPAQPVGCAEHHLGFAGTLSLREETFVQLVRDLCETALSHGFDTVLLISGHGGNFKSLQKAVSACRKLFPQAAFHTDADVSLLLQVPGKADRHFGISSCDLGLHAGEWETSLYQALGGEIRASRKQPGFVGAMDDQVIGQVFREGIARVSPNGILGNPERSSEAHGKTYYQELLAVYVSYFSEKLGHGNGKK